MIDPITIKEIFDMMSQKRRIELIKIIRNNKEGMTLPLAKNLLEQYWPPNGAAPTLLNANALFKYLNQDNFTSLEAERTRLLARLEEIDIELNKAKN